MFYAMLGRIIELTCQGPKSSASLLLANLLLEPEAACPEDLPRDFTHPVAHLGEPFSEAPLQLGRKGVLLQLGDG